jgi:hypothetical protein
MEKLMLEIVPMVERELGPLAGIGAPTRQATAVDVIRRDLPRPG